MAEALKVNTTVLKINLGGEWCWCCACACGSGAYVKCILVRVCWCVCQKIASVLQEAQLWRRH